MRMRSCIGAGLLVLAAAGPAAAMTLMEAEERALAANPQVQAARLEALAAAQRQAEAKGRHLGTVDLVGSYNSFESPRLVRPMSIELFEDPSAGFAQLPWDANQLHYGVALQIPLLTGGHLSEGDRIAALARLAAEQSAQFSREQIRFMVRAAYRDALLVGHALTTAQAYRDALVKDEADAQLKVRLGSLASVDAAKLTFALRGAEAEVATREAQLRRAQALLAALQGESPPEGGYDLVDLPDEPAVPVAGANAVQAALEGRSDLAAVRQSTRIAERRKALARADFGPRLSLEGSWLRNDAASLDAALDTYEISLRFKLPLFDGLTRVHARKEAELYLEIARQHERAKELEVSTQVVDATSRVDSARAQLAAGKAQRALGAEVARVEHLKLEQGAGKIEDYLSARAQEMQGETSYWQGLYALQNAVDLLEFVTAQGDHHD